jgi:hypothetical protein
VTTDVGCVNNRSIVIVPDGLMFQSQKGIYLLDRALRVFYIGAAVEAYNSQTVTSAQLIPNTNQVRFTLSSGIALVYDYFMGQWSTFTNVNAVDSAIWQQTIRLPATDRSGHAGNLRRLLRQRPVHQDAGDDSLAAIRGGNGFQRLRRAIIFGEYFSPHSLLVGVAYDFNSAVQQSDTITPVHRASLRRVTPLRRRDHRHDLRRRVRAFQWLLHFQIQKCTAVQLTIEDSSTGTVGEGFSLSALTLEVGVKRGLVKLPATRAVG